MIRLSRVLRWMSNLLFASTGVGDTERWAHRSLLHVINYSYSLRKHVLYVLDANSAVNALPRIVKWESQNVRKQTRSRNPVSGSYLPII